MLPGQQQPTRDGGGGGATTAPENPTNDVFYMPNQFKESRVLRGLIAGGVLGGLECLIMYPSIYLKTQLQLDYGRSLIGYKWARFALLQMGATDILRMYKGPIDCIRKTYATRGVAGFYTGCLVTVTASIPKVGVRFATTEAIVGHLGVDERGNHTLADVMFAGSIAAILETLIIGAPMETLMTQMIKDTRQNKPKLTGAVTAFGFILTKHGEAFANRSNTLFRFLPPLVVRRYRLTGIPGFYRGTMPIMARQIFSQIIRLIVFEVGRNAYRTKQPERDLSIALVAGLGALSGFISVLFTAPLDLVKTRMQGLFWNNYRSNWDCAKKLLAKEGPFVFFRGSAPRMVRVCMDMALSSLFYEFMCNYMEKKW